MARPDLSARRGLSKSALTTFAMCGQKAWQRKHYPRPFIKTERVTFGSCLDAAVESLIIDARNGTEPDIARALAESVAISERDEIEVDQAEIETALGAFVTDVMPSFDWHDCATQAHIHLPLHDWGEVDGHPDLILSSNAVWDVKSAGKPKVTARTIEGGMYAMLVAAKAGEPVPEFGYLVWVRDGGYWQGFGPDARGTRELKTGPRKGQPIATGHHIPVTFVDDELLRWTFETVSAYVRADRIDDVVNAKRVKQDLPPENFSFPGGPVRGSICSGCEYNPATGGACRLAVMEGNDDDTQG